MAAAEHEPIDAALVAAAAEVLGREGRGGLTLSAVAEAAQRSRVTLHRNGIVLDDLLDAVAARAAADLRSSLWPVLVGSGPAAERFDAALHTLCEVVERHRRQLAALFHVPDAPRRPSRRGRTTGFDFIEPFERLLRDGVADRTLASDDPATDAELVVNAVTWTYVHLRQAHRWPARRATERTIALATAHLRP